MKYSFSQLIDVDNLQNILESFYDITKFPTTIIDVAGNIVKLSDKRNVGNAWTSICTDFHRRNPDSEADCITSDTLLSNLSNEKQRYSIYRCKNGMIDVSIPIIIDGEHLANLFTGQFLLGPPNIDFFYKQAIKYNYDTEKYLEALQDVPIIDESILEPILTHLCNLADVISQMGLKEKKIIDQNNITGKVQTDNKALKGILPMCCFCNNIRNQKGEWEEVSHYIRENSQAQISHTYCPSCFEKEYPDMHKKMVTGKK